MILQAGSAIPSTPVELILSSSMATKVVLAILAMLSLFSWAIILAKWLEFRRVAARGAAFMTEFARVSKLDQAAALIRSGVDLTVVTDDLEAAKAIAVRGKQAGVVFDVLVEVDCGERQIGRAHV